MFFHQFRVQDMGCASYLVGSVESGKAVVIDPNWNIEQYMEMAAANNLQITHILETHLHADHVSGNRRLAALTNATIYLHQAAQAGYPHQNLQGEEVLTLGQDLRVKVLFTPGHTWEMLNFLLEDPTSTASPSRLLSGDTLFIGDVGRPDFAGEQGAGALYDSLRQSILPLPDQTEIYPSHLSGSLCGRSLSNASVSTLGQEKTTNPALQMPNRTAFIEFLTADLPPHPQDFMRIVELNRAGPPSDQLVIPKLPWLEVRTQLKTDVQLVDVREPNHFWDEHLVGALSVPSKLGHFGAHVAAFMPATKAVILTGSTMEEIERARAGLAVVGRYAVNGYILFENIGDGLAWKRRGDIEADQFLSEFEAGSRVVLMDVRQPGEWEADHLPGSINLPVRELAQRLDEVAALADRGSYLVITCASGNRSSVGASYLEQQGWQKVQNLKGGMSALRTARVEMVVH